jgi:ribosome-binding factor A
MAGHRIERVNERLKREVSQILMAEVQDPRVGVLTVTRVVAAPDLTLARIFVHVVGDEAERKETFVGLKAATPFIRTALGQRLPMRRVPELRFEADRNLEHALRIEQLLHEAGTPPEPAPEVQPAVDDESEDGESEDGVAGDGVGAEDRAG